MKKLLKVMVKGPFDSQMQSLCVLRHHCVMISKSIKFDVKYGPIFNFFRAIFLKNKAMSVIF